MASGSQNMTTYNARIVTGSNGAASPGGALLQSGAGRADNATGDTWIFLDTLGGTSSPWGIKHDQANNKILFYGSGTNSAWTRLNTGDTYLLGKLGLGYNPETSGNTEKLYVNGTSYLKGNTRINGSLHLHAATYGNTASDMISGTGGLFSWGDKGPQITFDTSATPGGGQAGALIYTDHDTAATGVSWHFVSNQSDWNVTSKRFHARTSISIGTNLPSTSYALSVTGNTYNNGIVYFANGTTYYINNSAAGYLASLSLNGNLSFTNSGTAFRGINYGTMGDNDQWRIGGAATAANAGYMELATADDGNEPIYVRQYTGVFSTLKRTLTLLDASGHSTFPGRIYFSGDGLYHVGSAATYQILGIIDSGDQYGTGIRIGAGGLFVAGSGESASTIVSNLSLTAGGTETTYITSDNSIVFYPGQNGYDAAAKIEMTAGRIWAGVSGNTTRENQIGVQSGSGGIYMYAQAATGGGRGIYLPAHGSGAAKSVFAVDTNNGVTFYGSLSGNASSASQLYVTGSSGTQYLTGVPAYETKNQIQYIYSPCYMNGGNLYAYNMNATAGYLKSTNNSNTVTIGSQNTGFCHITNSANIPFWFNKDIQMEQGKVIGGAGTQYRPYQIYIGRSGTSGSNAINSANPLIEFSNGDRSQYGQLVYTDYDSVRAPDGLTWVGNQSNSWFQAPRVFGAVWNDYAEYRETKEDIQPGRCVVETGHGDLILSTERLQPGCEIVSDTFGFAIGETDKCKTPTACAGRVLAYLYEDNSLAKPGDPVCSGPNGTVSIMTHEEEIQWPSRIIATISEIPDYDEWEYGSADEFGNKEKLKVDGRIWIRVR